jgi:hypothetical protein
MATITRLHFPKDGTAGEFPGDRAIVCVALRKFIGGTGAKVYQACPRVLIGRNTDA